MSRPPCNRKVVDHRIDLCNLAQDFASGGASCRAGVRIPTVVNIVQGLQATGESEAYAPPRPAFFWLRQSSIFGARPLFASRERSPLSISARSALSFATSERS